MSHLTRSITACPCGKPHTCPIRTVRIGEGALLSLPAVCEGYRRILLVADTNTYAACGYNALKDVAKLNTDMEFVSVKTPEGSLVPAFNIIRPIAEADFIINIAKLKTHGMTKYSAGMKNLFGCIPGLQKPEMHSRFPDPHQFCRMICELDRLISP